MKKRFLTVLLSILAVSVFTSGIYAQGYTIRDKNDVNEFDRVIMNPYNKALDYTATGFEVVSLAMPLVCLMAPAEDYLEIGIQYAETMAVAYGLRCLFKGTVERARPYMYFDGAPEKDIADGDWNRSFMSGHSIMTFASAGFTTFMFLRYCPDSEWTVPVIVTSWGIAVTTGILRVASGNHFVTDVLAGSATGVAVGFLVPLLNTLWFEPALKNTPVEVLPNGVVFKLKW